MRQPELFQVEARTLARRDGHATSKAGAVDAAARLGELQAFALYCIDRWPGRTSTELARLAGHNDPRRINRRLNELVKAGLIVSEGSRACSITGRQAMTWARACAKGGTG